MAIVAYGMEEDFPNTMLELEERFSSDDACRDYLFQLRWPEGFLCPRCRHGKYWTHSKGLNAGTASFKLLLFLELFSRIPRSHSGFGSAPSDKLRARNIALARWGINVSLGLVVITLHGLGCINSGGLW